MYEVSSQILWSRRWPFVTFWCHVTSSLTWPWIRNMWFRFILNQPSVSHVYLAEILICVNHLAKHIPVENALIHFWFPGAKLGVTAFCNFVLVAAPSLGTLFELFTPTIGPRASLLRYLDLSIENALLGWKMGANRGRSHQIFTLWKRSYFSGT